MQFCPWEPATYFGLYSSNVPTLLYYSHIPALLIALFWGYFIYKNSRAYNDARLYSLVLLFISFALWNIFDLLLWATNRPDITMFFWSLQVLIEVFIFFLGFYLVYTHVRRKDLSLRTRAIILSVLAPFILLVPTSFNLIGVNLADCTAIENIIAKYYSYALEALFLILISYIALEGYRTALDNGRKKEIILLSAGVFIFLMMFIYGNLIGSFLDNWVVAQYGLFGMPVFATFLVYTIVRFKSFNAKILGSEGLLVGLVILISSQFFFTTNFMNGVLNAITLALLLGFGLLLVKSVRKEVEARAKIEGLARQLQTVNTELASANTKLKALDQQKTEFISFATHQLRSPLTAIKGMSSLILEGDLGPVPAKIKETVEDIYTSVRTQVTIVEDYLNMSRLELGTMKYDMVDLDCKHVLAEAVNELEQSIEAKHLELKLNINDNETYPIHADHGKFKQVIMNTIDNSIKYTPSGSITVSLEKNTRDNMVRIIVNDTGVGIKPDVMPKLFQKFTRAPDASMANIHGTGLGLYIAKEIITAHNGRIWAESAGENKGSQFYIEIPEVK